MICYYADLGMKCLQLVKENFPCGLTNQEQYLDLRSATSSVWNFFTRSTDFFSRENQFFNCVAKRVSSLNNIVDGHACLVIINMDFFSVLCYIILFICLLRLSPPISLVQSVKRSNPFILVN